jgi:hypothetical protein
MMEPIILNKREMKALNKLWYFLIGINYKLAVFSYNYMMQYKILFY